jgi:ribosomal protein L37AE/L43A
MTSNNRKPIYQKTEMGVRSKRASIGKISVIPKKCPYCKHHKSIITEQGLSKCSKCKR